ncbi:unnamed protein product [Penicillium nalgiovense]|nr:unnamed protein product [Penicillium nalgiovense]CAG8115230.1 unnamed protein product [Penicillium nalgiovense]
MLAFNYHPQAALDAPRICIAADKVIDGKPVIYVEKGISVEAIEGLNKLGHPIEALTGWKRAPCLVAARSSGVTTMRGPGFIVLAVTQEVMDWQFHCFRYLMLVRPVYQMPKSYKREC